MQNEIKSMIEGSIGTKRMCLELVPQIEKAAHLVINTLKNNKKIILAGNGGSSTQAAHISAEFVGRYKIERRGLPAIALTTDLAVITAIGNDYGFDTIFERQIEALGNEGDVFIALSTSGNSKNIINAVEKAKKMNVHVIGLLGNDGGKLRKLLAIDMASESHEPHMSLLASSHADTSSVEIIVPSSNIPRIQEAHLMILHIICELVEKELFGK